MGKDARIQEYETLLEGLQNSGQPRADAVRTIAIKYPAVNAARNLAITEAHNSARAFGRGAAVEEPSAIAMKAALPGASAAEVLGYMEAGVPPAEAAWEQHLKAEMKGGLSKTAATRNVIKRAPDVHAAYIASWNKRFGGRVPAS